MNKKLFLFLFLFVPFNLISQTEKLNFEHVSEHNNLSHFFIRSITQDKAGFLWIGTRSGLSIFDSYKFSTLTGAKNKMSDDVIKCIQFDVNEDVWIGTFNGLNKYSKKQKQITQYRKINDDRNSICGNDIIGISEDKFANLWIATSSGLSRYDRKTDKFINYFHDAKNIKTLQSNLISSLFLDRNDNLFIGYQGLGLDIISVSNNISDIESSKQNELPIRHYAIKDTGNNYEMIAKVYQDRAGKFWVATNSSGLFMFDLKEQPYSSGNNFSKIRSINYSKNNAKYFISNNNVSDIVEDKEFNLYIGTFGGGLNVLNKDRTKLSCYNYDPDNFYCLSDNYIKSLYIDYTGNLWIGCYSGGLNKYSPSKYKFNNYRNHPADKTTLANNQINAIYQDQEGIIWVGTREGLNRFDRKNICKNYIYKSTDLKYANSNLILTICGDKSGNLWIGTYNGINCFDKKKGAFKDFNVNLQKLLQKKVTRALVCDSANNLWIGSTGGLIKYNIDENKYILYTKNATDSNSLISSYVWSLFIDNFSNLWVGTNTGLCKLNENTNNFSRYIYKINDNTNSLDNLITCISQDKNNIIWMGTYSSGVHKIEPEYKNNSPVPNFENSNILHFEIPGLVKECVNGILNDNNNNLWICSDMGITRINSKRDNFRTYNSKDGLSPNEFSTGAYYNRNGELFFGGKNGMVSFFPDRFKENETIPNIALTSFKILNNEICHGVEAAELQEIELSYEQNEFSFSFAALDFTETTNNQYKYKLEGFEDNWIDCGNKNEATFMNLKGGEYTFRVIGSNNDKKWNFTGLNIKIIIHPPIWDTTWFKLLVIVLILCIIYLILKYRAKRIEKQKDILKNQVEERTKQLSEKTEQLDEINSIISVQNIELRSLNENLVDKNRFIEHQNEELVLLKNDLEIKAAQAEIANRSKSEFLANMSHEIRTPMNAILGFSEILSTKLKDPELMNYTSIITSSGNALLTIINDILDLSKIEAGKLELQPSYIDLQRIILEIKQLLIPRVSEKGLDFITEVSDNLPKGIYLDEVRIRQVIMNLIGNAIKFTEKGYIKIGVSANSYHEQNERQDNTKEKSYFRSDIRITVEDTGIGIPKEQIEKIFRPFEQVDGQSTRRFGGTGLGLSISTRLITMMGGMLSVTGEPGKGSLFTIIIPNLKSNSGIDLSSQFINQAELSIEFLPAKILVVDDIAVNRDLVKTYLENYNLSITKAEDGGKALQEIKRDKYDLILLDCKMPGISGEEVAKILKSDEITKNIPIIMLTASALKEEEERLLKITDGFLTKPVNKLNLIQEIKKFLPFKEKIKLIESETSVKEKVIETILTPEQIEKITQILQGDLFREWESVSKTKAMGSVKAFAINLQKTAEEYSSEILRKYSNELLESVNLFQVGKVKTILNDYSKIINIIKS